MADRMSDPALELEAALAPGTQVVVRDEEWLVRAVQDTRHDGQRVEVTGVSELVRGQDAVFFTALDQVTPLDPRKTRLVADGSSGFRRSRLWLEALLRRTPLEAVDTSIAVGHRGLLDDLSYQRRPAALALSNLRPRALVADAVGLGKTLEIGMLLAELIRRGRGERILVVTPRAVLEQFQHELWTRFAIPLVRLDSDGIQKVRQRLPATRNPFTYYKRVIISIDTLKSPDKYRHHLEQHRWDAVVIDECHNVVNPGTQNFQLAELLARQTEALILASATPHNGKSESFAQLINLLDPTAIADPKSYSADDIKHLYVRRHRGSDDVKYEVAHNWKERAEPDVIPVTPSGAEEAVLDELNRTWLRPGAGSGGRGGLVTGSGASLVPWTLFKGFLSSPLALRQTIRQRRVGLNLRLASSEVAGEGGAAAVAAELRALDLLDELAAKAQADGPAKLDALVSYLREIGVGPGSAVRVVVFSERIATLDWLAAELPQRLKLAAKAVGVLYAKLNDKVLQDRVEQFGQAESPLRVLLAGDLASEGLNLHRQCHHLVHFDLPWSLIRIQQRNGRIDRYLQLERARITALALTPADPELKSDVHVLTRLLAKEHAAYRALGDAGALMALHDEEAEEKAVMRALRDRQDLDELAPDPEPEALNPFEWLMAIGGAHRDQSAPEVAPQRGLFDSDAAFLEEALAELAEAEGAPEQVFKLAREPANGLLALDPPVDLVRRLEALPQEYLAEQQVAKRLRVTSSQGYGESRLVRARESGTNSWPDVSYLAPLHPLLEWAADRALARFGRNEAPVVAGTVPAPVFLLQGLWSNHRGQPVIMHWGAATRLGLPDDPEPEIADLVAVLEAAGIRYGAVNPGLDAGQAERLQALVPLAVAAERAHLEGLREQRASALAPRLDEFGQRLQRWAGVQQVQLELVGTEHRRRREQSRIERVTAETRELMRSLSPAGEPLVRVVGVIVPRAWDGDGRG